MNLPDSILAPQWHWLGHALLAAVLGAAFRSAPWRRLRQPWLLNLWLGAAVALMLLWSIKTGIRPGLNFHLLGATALTLMFGPQLALVCLTLVVFGITLAGMAGWQSLSLNILLMGVLPIAISHALYRITDKKLPNHFFVYVFINAFFGAALAIAATGFASAGLLAVSGAYPLAYLTRDYLPYFILMGWSEALLTGMAISLMIVFRPHWVCTFDDARYIHGK